MGRDRLLAFVTGETGNVCDLMGKAPLWVSGLFAKTTLSIVPVMLVFLFLQKYPVEGVAMTGLKG